MRRGFLVAGSIMLTLLLAGGLLVGGSGSFEVSVQGSTDVPDRTVTHDGETYTIGEVGTVGPAEALAVDVTVPDDRSHAVNIYEDDSGIEVAFSSGTGSQTHIFDESEVETIGMGTYGVALVDSGEVEALTLAVIEGYDLSIDAPEQATVGESPAITIELEQTRADGPPDNVQVGFDVNGDELRVDAEQVDERTYEAPLPTDDLGAGTYETIAVATDDDGDLVDEEILGLTSAGDIEVVEPDASVSVETGSATEVDETTATLQGSLTELENADRATVGFEYGPAGEGLPNDVTVGEQDSTSEFDAVVEGLTANTTYEFRAFGDVGETATTGETATFTTPESDDDISISVKTNSATEVGEENATLSGELTEVSGTSEATVYFEYGPAEDGFTEQTPSEELAEPSSFDVPVDGLDANTEYEFRAVTVADDTSQVGDTLTFTTAESDEDRSLSVETNTVADVDQTSATLSGVLTAVGDDRQATVYFEYGPVAGGLSEQTDSITLDDIGSFDMSIDGLEPGSGYEFRAVAETEDKSETGATASFTTADSDDSDDGIGGGPPNGADDGGDDNDEGTENDNGSDDTAATDQSNDEDDANGDDNGVQQPTDDDSGTTDESSSEESDEQTSDDGLSLSLVVPVVAVVLLAAIVARRSH